MDKQKLIRIFDKQAAQYDKQREDPKQKRWRQHLLREAKGHVLELAVGAGANLPFYPPGVKITAMDFSEAMLGKARQAAESYRMDADFICGDIEEMNFPEHAFDTVVSTLSLCSYDDPLQVLGRINRWCRPGGAILFRNTGSARTRPQPLCKKRLILSYIALSDAIIRETSRSSSTNQVSKS